MHPKDPVYPLTKAVERVNDTIPDQDAEDWLMDVIASGRVTWSYFLMEDPDRMGRPSLIDIPPMAAIMEVPGLKIDKLKGMVAVRRPYKEVVECRIVVSRDDLDRELAKITASPEATDRQPDAEPQADDSTARDDQLQQAPKLSESADPKSSAVRPNCVGRKKGSGSYDDGPLLKKMKDSLDGEKARSVQKAAEAVVKRAKGGGTDESKIKRLVKKYGEGAASQQKAPV